MRFQQLTGPVMAKGFEDTALYRSYALSSLNEVGMDPKKFGVSIEEFHHENEERFHKWPHTLLATSTHDTKRSEDVRMRINVLSECPEKWQQALERWQAINSENKRSIDLDEVPDANEEYLFYQTLVGTYPFGSAVEGEFERFRQRISDYMIKAVKEAKIHTSWINPNEPYEDALRDFVYAVLDRQKNRLFIADFEEFAEPIYKAGAMGSLSQLILKMTVPGVPDFYQGSELFEFHLVDPDNRQPVDFGKRQKILEGIHESVHLFDETLKFAITQKILQERKRHSELFAEGNYCPIEVEGQDSNRIIAFSRTSKTGACIVVVSRFFYGQDPLDWNDTSFVLTPPLEGTFCDLFTGNVYELQGTTRLFATSIFSQFPFLFLIRK